MYQGIENGALKTKAEKQKQNEQSMQKLMMIAPVIDKRKKN